MQTGSRYNLRNHDSQSDAKSYGKKNSQNQRAYHDRTRTPSTERNSDDYTKDGQIRVQDGRRNNGKNGFNKNDRNMPYNEKGDNDRTSNNRNRNRSRSQNQRGKQGTQNRDFKRSYERFKRDQYDADDDINRPTTEEMQVGSGEVEELLVDAENFMSQPIPSKPEDEFQRETDELEFVYEPQLSKLVDDESEPDQAEVDDKQMKTYTTEYQRYMGGNPREKPDLRHANTREAGNGQRSSGKRRVGGSERRYERNPRDEYENEDDDIEESEGDDVDRRLDGKIDKRTIKKGSKLDKKYNKYENDGRTNNQNSLRSNKSNNRYDNDHDEEDDINDSEGDDVDRRQDGKIDKRTIKKGSKLDKKYNKYANDGRTNDNSNLKKRSSNYDNEDSHPVQKRRQTSRNY